MSGLIRNTVGKGQGSCLCVGNSYKNVVWTGHVVDNILCEALDDVNCHRVIVMCYDRNKETIYNVLQHAKHTGLLDKAEWREKLSVHTELETSLESQISPLLTNQTAESYVAVLVYSLSEQILMQESKFLSSFQRDMQFLRYAQQELKKNILYIACLHSSLHSSQLTQYLQTFFNTCIYIVPNYGTYSEYIACEVMCVYRSMQTQRVKESIEMCVWEKGMLVPLKGSLRGGGEEGLAGEEGKVTHKKDEDGGEDGSQAVGKAEVQIHTNIQGMSLQNNKARLISFESTDPEFDEDSDPDADLDL
ncbi:hypothetical protein EON65_29860 [archaeon]|nr:MAG: hypothetical protein EON65_29860 [archaeon]